MCPAGGVHQAVGKCGPRNTELNRRRVVRGTSRMPEKGCAGVTAVPHAKGSQASRGHRDTGTQATGRPTSLPSCPLSLQSFRTDEPTGGCAPPKQIGNGGRGRHGTRTGRSSREKGKWNSKDDSEGMSQTGGSRASQGGMQPTRRSGNLVPNGIDLVGLWKARVGANKNEHPRQKQSLTSGGGGQVNRGSRPRK